MVREGDMLEAADVPCFEIGNDSDKRQLSMSQISMELGPSSSLVGCFQMGCPFGKAEQSETPFG